MGLEVHLGLFHQCDSRVVDKNSSVLQQLHIWLFSECISFWLGVYRIQNFRIQTRFWDVGSGRIRIHTGSWDIGSGRILKLRFWIWLLPDPSDFWSGRIPDPETWFWIWPDLHPSLGCTGSRSWSARISGGFGGSKITGIRGRIRILTGSIDFGFGRIRMCLSVTLNIREFFAVNMKWSLTTQFKIWLNIKSIMQCNGLKIKSINVKLLMSEWVNEQFVNSS